MKKLIPSAAISTLLLAGSCSETDALLNAGDIQARIDTVTDCLPDVFQKLNDLLAVAKLMKSGGTNPSDPPGMVVTVVGLNVLNVEYDINNDPNCHLSMDITFWDEAGGQQPISIGDSPLPVANNIANRFDNAAGALATPAGQPTPYFHGTWTFSGNLSGSGNLTGRIGGLTNQNELESLYISAGVPAAPGPLPAVQDGSITTNITGGGQCVGTISMPNMETDTLASQFYPVGTITITLNGPAGVTTVVTIVANGTVDAVVSVANIGSVSFSINLDTLVVTQL